MWPVPDVPGNVYDSPDAAPVLLSTGSIWMKRLRIWVFLLLAIYSAALIIEEWNHGRPGVRPYFSDIVGPVAFHGVNTTLSASLLWAAALVFAMLRQLDRVSPRRRAFYTSQVLFFCYVGIDERFMFHEWFDFETGINDTYLFAAIGLLEIGLLVFLGDLRTLPAGPRRWIAGAALLYGTSALVDMLEPKGLQVRLALEDLPKTWAGVCVFLFAWCLFDRVAAERQQRS
jgi:hypothetical protein